ncbi:hypothetical protein SESBI_39350 [Sesbania bispinosa]|nr:hypothetical protein SESBI_39350 [Sesbania bispinosa]
MTVPENVQVLVATNNFASGNDGKNTGAEDLHGDWMLVSGNRRSQKSHPFKKGNNDERVLNSMTKSDGIEDNKSFDAFQGGNKFVQNIPKDSRETIDGFTFIAEGPKLLTRKKRPRREHIHIQPTIVSNEKYKAIMERPNTNVSSRKEGLYDTSNITAAKKDRSLPKGDQVGPIIKSTKEKSGGVLSARRTTSPTCNSLPYGINTTMHVEVVPPNHLRLLDDNDPPNPRQVSGMIVEGHEQPI